ncbi:MAG: hypothetical protein A2544_02680 [Candidatus Zambryskibacteria bacterium RIFOXYD2_FULL_43_10]|uniref:Uncharacterized protein n=1 Tax=Candidatus Zambryskibacteria bacterium RIFOXYD2_FULL_43_10 TaxID=1802782 RepID=A0A1G2V8R9_9BACT|nr:MAG: hypothetical protein A2544_02680 [Candidatus Zambryskibacteria bacterium RIFOXYD2_FULL_43_10]
MKSGRQQKGESHETKFISFCSKNKIKCIYLDANTEKKKKYLKDQQGKSPDFLCQKNNKSIFVEIKTHTLLTNEARNSKMLKTIKAKKSLGLSGTTIFEPFDPLPELKGVFEGYLRGASKKFKNIKDKYSFQRVLLLDGIQIEEIDICRIFLGKLLDVDRNTYIKKEKGLLDSTGSNVSAIVYWAENLNQYRGIQNPKARILLSEIDFKNFFEVFTNKSVIG